MCCTVCFRIVKSSRHIVSISNFLTNVKVHAPRSSSSRTTTMNAPSAPVGSLDSYVQDLRISESVVNNINGDQQQHLNGPTTIINIKNYNFSLFGGGGDFGAGCLVIWGQHLRWACTRFARGVFHKAIL